MTRDLVAIKNISNRCGENTGETLIYPIQFITREFVPLSGTASNRAVHVAVDRGLQHDQIASPKVLPIKVSAFWVYPALIQDTRRFGTHAHVEAAAQRRPLGHACCGDRLKRLLGRVEVSGDDPSILEKPNCSGLGLFAQLD